MTDPTIPRTGPAGRKAKVGKPAFAVPAADVHQAMSAPVEAFVEAASAPATLRIEAAVASAPVQEDPTPAAAAVADPVQPQPSVSPDTRSPDTQGSPTMATMAPPAFGEEKVQNLFGDVSTRVKTLMEKSGKLGEELVELTKGNVEAVVTSARVAAKGGESLGQDAAEYGKKNFESAVQVMKSYASAKSPTELFQLQSDYAKSSFDSAVAEASKFSESLLKLFGDVAQPLSSRYAVAAEKIKAATL